MEKKEDIPRSEGPPEPYHVLKRYRGLGGGLGRLYEARNNETGNPALVLMPGPKGDLRAEEHWQVRATANVTPPYLALEVERAPVDGQPRQLTWMLERWAAALGRIDDRPEARAHLTAGPKKPPPPRSSSLSGAVGLLLLLALGVTPWTHASPAPLDPIAPPVLDVDSPEPDPALFTSGVEAIARPMPQGPFKGQNRPPCKSRFEVVIRGGCWVAIEARPPCGNDAYDYEGKCYLPGYSAPRPPTSIHP